MFDMVDRATVQKWVWGLAFIDRHTYNYHVRCGHIQPPRHELYKGCPGTEKYYTKNEAEAIIRFFTGREMWERFTGRKEQIAADVREVQRA